VHCASEDSVLPVAKDVFSEVPGQVLLLEIDPRLLSSEVRYEAAAPTEGAGITHLGSAEKFPHVYGPIDATAIIRMGVMNKVPEGFQWPAELVGVSEFLHHSDQAGL
jgi:uncharacterized protein (DUF952 family)